MNRPFLIAVSLVGCAASSLFAQSGITFTLSNRPLPPGPRWSAGSNPTAILLVKKTDPRAVDMFSFDVVDSEGKVKFRYERIIEDRIAPVIEAGAREWETRPFLGNTTPDMVLSVRNVKVVFAGDDDPIVKKRDADLMAGRKFSMREARSER